MRTVQTTEIWCSWKEEVRQKEIDDLNADFKRMELPLTAFYEARPDSWIIKFVQEWNEE